MMRPETTDFAEITESVNLIPLNLLAFTNTNTYLPGWFIRFCFKNREFKFYADVVIVFIFCSDIVGQLTGIKSTFSEEAHSKGRVMATIKIQRLSLILISKSFFIGVCSHIKRIKLLTLVQNFQTLYMYRDVSGWFRVFNAMATAFLENYRATA
ncbi:unnamed protein product [Brassica oleracea var. botrytis]